jgi:putative salt-induced outer membrane protein YdiY
VSGIVRSIWIVGIALGVAAPGPVYAQTGPEPAPPEAAEVPADAPSTPEVAGDTSAAPEESQANWTGPSGSPGVPPVPDPKAFDWIKMSSGEWLKGDIDGMRDHSLQFDSDEFDTLTVDFDDVEELYSARKHTYVFYIAEKQVVVAGTAAIKGDAIRIREGKTVRVFERGQILSIVSGEPSEWNYWSGSIGLGATVRSGNSNTTDASANFSITREDALTRGNVRYLGSISSVDGVENANNHRFNLALDIFVSRRFYITAPTFEAFRDRFQNIDMRLTPAAGVGYHLMDRPKVRWDLEFAAGAQYTELVSAQAGDPTYDTVGIAIFRTDSSVDITSDIEWNTDFRFNLGVPEADRSNFHFLTDISFDLIWNFDLDVTFTWDRQLDPVADANGVVPARDDYKIIFGLAWDF